MKWNYNIQIDCSASLNPLFEQIFVIRVSSRAQRDDGVTEFTAKRVDENGCQSLIFVQKMDFVRHIEWKVLLLKRDIYYVYIWR